MKDVKIKCLHMSGRSEDTMTCTTCDVRWTKFDRWTVEFEDGTSLKAESDGHLVHVDGDACITLTDFLQKVNRGAKRAKDELAVSDWCDWLNSQMPTVRFDGCIVVRTSQGHELMLQVISVKHGG